MTSINNLSAQGASRAYVQNTEAAGTPTVTASPHHHHQHHAAAAKADSVTLSDSARSLASARDAVQNAPDVRDQKVADIKQRISDGTYQVSSRVLAQKIVDATRTPSQ